ncbi:hypothetical protein D3C71_1816780 [compost metagenome]
MDVVGPQLGLHDHRQPGLGAREKARRGPGQVIGQIAVLHAPGILGPGEQGLNPLGAGRRHAGDGDGQVWIARQQLTNQRRGGNALAHRHRVQPDATGLQGRQAESEAFADTFGIGRCAPRTPGQTPGDQRQAEMQQQGVEGSIHGRAA